MKHAFLIIAHDNFGLLKRLLKRIDHTDSNIYIHIDKKSIFTKGDKNNLKSVIKLGKLSFIPRTKVTWGGYSMIDCEMRLLKCAVLDRNDYYHFMSGHDYLINNINVFMNFFNNNAGKEYIDFSKAEETRAKKQRYSVYWPFQDIVGKNRRNPLYWLNIILVKIQIKFGINRLRNITGIQFETGNQWCSITSDFANYIIHKEDDIKKLFKYSFCCDETFVQTIFANAEGFKNYMNIHDYMSNYQSIRAIDWKRGKPYVWSSDDYKELINSGKLICRKVDTNNRNHLLLLDMLDIY